MKVQQPGAHLPKGTTANMHSTSPTKKNINEAKANNLNQQSSDYFKIKAADGRNQETGGDGLYNRQNMYSMSSVQSFGT